MNENERKFFLKRFFSFNVPNSLTTGSANASFNEGSELDDLNPAPLCDREESKSEKLNESSQIDLNAQNKDTLLNQPLKDMIDFNSSTDSSSPLTETNNLIKNSNQSSELEVINKNVNKSMESIKLIDENENLETEKLLNEEGELLNNKKMPTPLSLRGFKFDSVKNSPILPKLLIKNPLNTTSNSMDYKVSNEPSSTPQSAVNKETLINLTDNEKINDFTTATTTVSSDLNANTNPNTNKLNKRIFNDGSLLVSFENESRKNDIHSKLQHQYSIELKPFKKKEVHIKDSEIDENESIDDITKITTFKNEQDTFINNNNVKLNSKQSPNSLLLGVSLSSTNSATPLLSSFFDNASIKPSSVSNLVTPVSLGPLSEFNLPINSKCPSIRYRLVIYKYS